jgi:hypothetical protein
VNQDWKEPRVLLAAFASVLAATALFTGHMSAGEWIAAQGVVTTLFGVHSIADDKVADRHHDDPA